MPIKIRKMTKIPCKVCRKPIDPRGIHSHMKLHNQDELKIHVDGKNFRRPFVPEGVEEISITIRGRQQIAIVMDALHAAGFAGFVLTVTGNRNPIENK